jgi:hypothetical protein
MERHAIVKLLYWGADHARDITKPWQAWPAITKLNSETCEHDKLETYLLRISLMRLLIAKFL